MLFVVWDIGNCNDGSHNFGAEACTVQAAADKLAELKPHVLLDGGYAVVITGDELERIQGS
jgi:hypothetical protein